MIFLKIINKKEVLSLLVEKKEWIGVFRDQKYQKIVHDNFFGLARFCTIFIYRTIFFVHDKIFDLARNRARSHDRIFIVISNPALNRFSL